MPKDTVVQIFWDYEVRDVSISTRYRSFTRSRLFFLQLHPFACSKPLHSCRTSAFPRITTLRPP